jgi:hypothetical protein
MRKLAILAVVLAGVALGSYFLFFKKAEAPTPPVEPSKEQKKAPAKPPPKKPSPVFQPSKFHPDHHYTGPKNRYADDYFKDEDLREELHDEREKLADTLWEYDGYNHYDRHADYQDAYDRYYHDDDDFYRDYYDYMYPQFDDREWEHLNSIYSDPDVKEYKKEKHETKKAEKDTSSSPGKFKPTGGKAQTAKAAKAKLKDPVVKKEQEKKKEFLDNKLATISKIAPNTKPTYDLFQAKKSPLKFDIFGIHQKETFAQALTDSLRKKVLSRSVLITDGSSDEIYDHYASEEKAPIDYKKDELLAEVENHAGKKIMVVVKESELFGDDGLLSQLMKAGYTIKRYTEGSKLEKYESTGPE